MIPFDLFYFFIGIGIGTAGIRTLKPYKYIKLHQSILPSNELILPTDTEEDLDIIKTIPIRSKQKNGKRHKSKYIGVSYEKRTRYKHWRPLVYYQNKTISLKYFNTQKQAAKVYDKKAFELFGDKAKLNFPEKYGLPANK